MNLNVGCGTFRADGWTNLDSFVHYDPDVTGSLAALPFVGGSFERVYLGHVLEHVPWEAVPGALAEVRRVLAPGGEVLVVGPDVEAAVRGGMSYEDMRPLMEDWGPFPSPPDLVHSAADRHHWNCTAERTRLALCAADLEDVYSMTPAEVPEPWPITSRIWWQCAVRGRRAG